MAARLTAYVVVSIVVATLIAGLIVGAQRDDSDGPVDLIVHNAAVYTADRRGSMAEAVAIRGNQILDVGSNREIVRLQRPQTVMIDARGGAVLPGFNDGNRDLIAGGLSLQALDLSTAVTVSDVLERVASWSAANPTAAWVVGRGWSGDQLRNGTPSRQLLDTVVKDRPVILYGADGDTAWVNSRALRLGDITRKTADPEPGAIARDRKGEPNGVLTGSAVQLVEKLVPPPTREQRMAAIRAAITEANALGVTSVQSLADEGDDLELYDAFRRSGELTLRVYSGIRVERPLTDAAIQALDGIRTKYPDDPLFKAGALSIRVDGELASRTAALLEPYEDTSERGATFFEPDHLNRTARLADAAGWQIVAHATGDRAVRMSLNAFAHAVRSNRSPVRQRRHRIEGAALVDEADRPRFGPLGVLVSLDPARAMPTPSRVELLSRHLGEERLEQLFPFRTISEETRVVFGSAWPARSMNPFEALRAAVTRTTPDGTPEGGWRADERLELKPAIDALTSTAAWASFDEQRKGSISAGMLADLIVLSDDILTKPVGTLASTSVRVTVFDGKIVFQRTPRAETEPAPAPSLQH